MSARYEKAREVFEALEAIVELEDQVELDAERLGLMRNPTKAKAASMYEAGIRLWLSEHGEDRIEDTDLLDAILELRP